MGDSMGAATYRATWPCGSAGLVVTLEFDSGGDRELTDNEMAVARRIERYASNVLYLPTDRLPEFGDRVFYRETCRFPQDDTLTDPGDGPETSDLRWEAVVISRRGNWLVDLVDDDGNRRNVGRWRPIDRERGEDISAGWCWPFEAAIPPVAEEAPVDA